MQQKIPASKLKPKFNKLEHNTTIANPPMVNSCDSETPIFLDISGFFFYFKQESSTSSKKWRVNPQFFCWQG